MKAVLALASLTLAATMPVRAHAQSAAQIFATMGPRVARVDFEGELYNGEKEGGTGTAFLITSDGYLLTCKHVVPDLANYKAATLSVRIGHLEAAPRPVTVIWVSQNEDLALLKVDLPEPPAAIPLEDKLSPPGTDVVALGFPANFDLNMSKGIVTGPADKGRYLMDAALNPGNSGGPIIDLTGRAVGVAWGAALRWKVGGEVLPLDSIHYFIPAKRVLADLPADVRAKLTVGVSPTLDAAPLLLRQAFPVDLLKRGNPFAQFFKAGKPPTLRAEPGYRITGWRVAEDGFNAAPRVDVVIAPDGGTAIANVERKFVPAINRLRGRLNGTIELIQEKVTE